MLTFAFDNTKGENQLPDNKEMSFLGHLEELRWRLFKSVIAVLIFAVIIFVFTEWVITNIYISMSLPEFSTYQFFCKLSQSLGMGDALCASKIDLKLQSIKAMGQFTTNMYFALIGGVILGFPFIFSQVWAFIKPGLKTTEKRISKGVIFFSTLLFFLGILFGYFLVSPLCVQFFGNYKMSESIENIFTINSYISLITTSTFFSGLFFQLPIMVYIFTKLGMISPPVLKKYRKHALVVILILSAIITPPDIISQLLVSIPILVLYEASILVSKRVIKKKNEQSD